METLPEYNVDVAVGNNPEAIEAEIAKLQAWLLAAVRSDVDPVDVLIAAGRLGRYQWWLGWNAGYDGGRKVAAPAVPAVEVSIFCESPYRLFPGGRLFTCSELIGHAGDHYAFTGFEDERVGWSVGVEV